MSAQSQKGKEAMPAGLLGVRSDWTRAEILDIYTWSFPSLMFEAQVTHRRFHDPNKVQGCQLLSIKTGACPEDCGYCPQSAHYETEAPREKLMDPAEVFKAAASAKASGATRFCIGAAWRNVPSDEQFKRVVIMVRGIRSMGLEACATLGMLDEGQAAELASAGLTAYNHNLDTSPEYYRKIITTRTYDDRLETLRVIREAGITVCCGGIVGMGESRTDRIEFLRQLAVQNPHPESVPINLLVRVEGTPLRDVEDLDLFEFIRTIATARILMPTSKVRLSAGRMELSDEAQALCFLAGANSIFMGDKLLTTPNPGEDRDSRLFERLGLGLEVV